MRGAKASCAGFRNKDFSRMGLVDRGRLGKPLTQLFNLGRSYSLWVYQWGLACCAIEMGAAFGSPRYDVMRLGVIPLPASPRQADLVVISGTVDHIGIATPSLKVLIRSFLLMCMSLVVLLVQKLC